MRDRSSSTAPPSGPASGSAVPGLRLRWAVTVLLGLAAALILGLLVAWLSPPGVPQGRDGLVLAVFALAFAGPCIALAWLVLVAPRTVKPVASPRETVENSWARSAGLGAFGDLMWLSAVGAGVVSLLNIDLATSLTLLAVLSVGLVSFGLRYLVVRRRES